MEEEAARRQAGEIPESEMDPSCLMKKDSAPSTIYEIFSNNVGTFNPDSPTTKQGGEYNPFSPDSSATAAAFGNGQPVNGGDGPPANFYGQAAGEEYDLSAGLPISHTPDPTIEDVESALAELDSLPDGDNDPGHDRDTPEDDWQRYGDMETSSNQTDEMSAVNYQQQEQEPVLRHESPLLADSPDPYKSEPMAVPQRNGGCSPHYEGSPSGSPRSVEGFVTSVELNTAQEQLANSTAAAFDADATPLEQQSGPFSVYVSSSPEPASLDPLVDASVHKVASPSPSADYEMQDSAVNYESVGHALPSPVALDIEQHSNVFEQPPSPVAEDTSSVEIVHAQSMVEVVTPPSPTHEPELQFVTSQPLESEPVPSPVYTPAPLNDMMSNDLMSTSMILEQPISDNPEQVEQMMQFVTTNTEVVYNSLEQQQTAEMVHITSDSDRLLSPEVESGNLLDAEDSEASYPASSPAPVALSPVAAQSVESPVSHQSEEDDSLVEQMNRANINDSYNAPTEQIVSPSEQVEFVPSPVQEELVEAELLTATVEATPEEQITEPCDDRHSPVPSPIQLDHTPFSDVMPSTPIKEPMIGNRPISPIHTPKADIPVHDSEILSEIAPPSADQENALAPKAPVRPTPRTTTAATTRSRPTASAVASTKTTPATTNVKPGTPRPTARATPAARTTPGGAVRSSATTTTTKTTTTSKATPTARTPAARTTPSSRSTSATSTSTTRTTTTRTPLSRTATPSATRTTPSSSATRPTPSTGSTSRPTPTTRTPRPTTTPTSTTLKTTTARTTPRSASRPTSAATTPTTTRRGLTSSTTTTTTTVRRTLAAASTAAAKDSTDSKTSTTTTTATARAPYARKPLYPGPAARTATAGAKTTATADKDAKNSTNKMLSSRTTTVTRSTAGTTASRATTATAPTHKPLASKTTTATGPAKRVGGTTSTLKSRSTTTKTVLKAKSPVITTDSSDDKKEIPSPETNGEVKIAQEETSVEVVTKEENEEIVEVNGQEETITTTTTLTEMLVNGDGEH